MILVKLFEYQKTDQIEAQNVDTFRSVSSSLLTIDQFSLKIFGQKFQKVENDENRFFAITSSK